MPRFVVVDVHVKRRHLLVHAGGRPLPDHKMRALHGCGVFEAIRKRRDHHRVRLRVSRHVLVIQR